MIKNLGKFKQVERNDREKRIITHIVSRFSGQEKSLAEPK